MKKYRVIKLIGDGTFGSVVKAQNIETGEIVAIKKMKKKYEAWPECLKLREVQCLINLRSGNYTHENVIQLKSIFREFNELHFVFEFMEGDLYQLMMKQKKTGKYFSEDKIRNLMLQTFRGLRYIHKKGYFHRDMKPENLLTKSDGKGGVTIKIADFGLARQIRSRPPFTEYVSTRWYRAPEVLLKSSNYSFPIDMFACGVIMAELYMLRPLFPGKSETDEMYKLCATLGTPDASQWGEGHTYASRIGFKFPKFPRIPLERYIKNASPEAIQLMTDLMQWNPRHRPSCAQAMKYPYFTKHLYSPHKNVLGSNSSANNAFLPNTNTNNRMSQKKSISNVNNQGNGQIISSKSLKGLVSSESSSSLKNYLSEQDNKKENSSNKNNRNQKSMKRGYGSTDSDGFRNKGSGGSKNSKFSDKSHLYKLDKGDSKSTSTTKSNTNSPTSKHHRNHHNMFSGKSNQGNKKKEDLAIVGSNTSRKAGSYVSSTRDRKGSGDSYTKSPTTNKYSHRSFGKKNRRGRKRDRGLSNNSGSNSGVSESPSMNSGSSSTFLPKIGSGSGSLLSKKRIKPAYKFVISGQTAGYGSGGGGGSGSSITKPIVVTTKRKRSGGSVGKKSDGSPSDLGGLYGPSSNMSSHTKPIGLVTKLPNLGGGYGNRGGSKFPALRHLKQRIPHRKRVFGMAGTNKHFNTSTTRNQGDSVLGSQYGTSKKKKGVSGRNYGRHHRNRKVYSNFSGSEDKLDSKVTSPTATGGVSGSKMFPSTHSKKKIYSRMKRGGQNQTSGILSQYAMKVSKPKYSLAYKPTYSKFGIKNRY